LYKKEVNTEHKIDAFLKKADEKEVYKDSMKKEKTNKEDVNEEKIARSEKMQNLIANATDNEKKIIDVLTKHNGEMLRTEISRETGLSKSSLSVALNRLERKNIIEIDKTFTIHKVMFTSWFKSLKK